MNNINSKRRDYIARFLINTIMKSMSNDCSLLT